jgi:ABC-type bacteriocin/lantibiotic exporter with double-glycine peptidase domain
MNGWLNAFMDCERCLSDPEARSPAPPVAPHPQRLQLMSELLQGIKLIKLYAWERHFVQGVELARARQLDLMKKANLLKALTDFISAFTPLLVSLISFAVSTLVFGQTLNTSTVFTAVMLFNTVRGPLTLASQSYKEFTTMKLAEDRLSRYAPITRTRDKWWALHEPLPA